MRKIFIDTEFIEGTQSKRFLGITYAKTKPTIDLISIGMVDDKGNKYYAVSRDFNLEEAWYRHRQRTGCGDGNNLFPREYWHRENVLRPIFEEFKKIDVYAEFDDTPFDIDSFELLLQMYGKTNETIAKEINEYVGPLKDISFYGYFADYDWVVFCWLFGKMNNLPSQFPRYCRDLKQMLDETAESINLRADDVKTASGYPKNKGEHNALSDAIWNKELYEFLSKY